MKALRGKLLSDLDLLRNTLTKVQSDEFVPPPSLPQKTAEWNRTTKILTAKVQEYKDRLATLNDDEQPSPSLPEIIAKEKEIAAIKTRVLHLETQSKAFQGLPHDMDLARLEVERVRRELEMLTRQRDKLFEGLVEGQGA
jgi:HAUS augmin-like complex subunit 1